MTAECNFKEFAARVEGQFRTMSKDELFVLDVSGEEVWDAYLDAYPEGTNPVYRVRRYYDGSYDRGVIRRIGNLVTVKNGKVDLSIWDLPTEGLDRPFQVVCETMREFLRGREVAGIFRYNQKNIGFGFAQSAERNSDGSIAIWWDHFHARLADRHYTKDVGTVLGEAVTTVDMARRALEELSRESLEIVLELIGSNSIYRGSEFAGAVRGFLRLQGQYRLSNDKSAFLWGVALVSPYARFKNTVIGTLVQDLSNNVDVDVAVRMFEAKVAPTNYKRPTALVTQVMIDRAVDAITNLGLGDSLQRRYATLADVSVNNVLWVDGNAAPRFKDGVDQIRDILKQGVIHKEANADAATPIGIDEFMAVVLPKATSLEAYFSGQQSGNLVSLTAPVNADSVPLFKWGNGFAWSYNGSLTDSVRERVKKAGGNVNADFRVSLAWACGDDLDLHSDSPYGHIYYANKSNVLDVDMNASTYGINSIDPVENQSWVRPVDGKYTFSVKNFCNRSSASSEFTLEVADRKGTHVFSYPHDVRHEREIKCLEITIKGGLIEQINVIDNQIRSVAASREEWGVMTEQFVPVDTVMFSPNYWDGNSTGNKHWFFALKGCRNPESTRGFYNEFLREDLGEHRKAFELLSSKMQCPPSADQISGLGFSSTQQSDLLVRVTSGGRVRQYQVSFGG